jgi:hypothetical protein
VFGTTVLFGSLYAYSSDHDSTGKPIDLSGVGHCSGRTLNVTSVWSWTQYPSRPSVTEMSKVSNGFVGKNAIVWTGDGAFQEFVVQTVDDHLVTAKRVLNVQGLCHFTLDVSPQQCFNCFDNFGRNHWGTIQSGHFATRQRLCPNLRRTSCCIHVNCKERNK